MSTVVSSVVPVDRALAATRAIAGESRLRPCCLRGGGLGLVVRVHAQVERVERVEELVPRVLLAGEELNIVDVSALSSDSGA
jgi:hypothetical protein